MALPPVTDRQIRDILLKIAESESIRVTALEAEFLESITYRFGDKWTVEKRARAAQIAEKYRHQL
jgi:hypothetical protein